MVSATSAVGIGTPDAFPGCNADRHRIGYHPNHDNHTGITMQRLLLTGMMTASLGLLAVDTADAQFGLPSTDTFGQGRSTTRRRSTGRTAFGRLNRPPRRRSSTTNRTTTRRGSRSSAAGRRNAARRNNRGLWRRPPRSRSLGYPGVSRRSRTRQTVRWQVYGSYFTYGDAQSVSRDLRRSGYRTHVRRRTINYRPIPKSLYDVYIQR